MQIVALITANAEEKQRKHSNIAMPPSATKNVEAVVTRMHHNNSNIFGVVRSS